MIREMRRGECVPLVRSSSDRRTSGRGGVVIYEMRWDEAKSRMKKAGLVGWLAGWLSATELDWDLVSTRLMGSRRWMGCF